MMPFPAAPFLLWLMSVPVAADARAGEPAWQPLGEEVAQLTFHQRIVIRVPRLPDPPEASMQMRVMPPPKWDEKKGPRCVAIPAITGAMVNRPDSVDLVLIDGNAYRAHLRDKCPALDFYRGFYMRQTSDGMLCSGRDSLRSRSGGDCEIKAFKRLVRKR